MKKVDFFCKIFTRKQVLEMTKKVNQLGERSKLSGLSFLKFRLISSIIVFLVVLYVFEWGYIYAPIVTFFYYHLIYYVLIEAKLRKRCDDLDIEALYFFEIVTLALESGHNISRAIAVACENVDSELAREFERALMEVRYGKSLDEALDSLRTSIPSDTINNIILTLSEANLLGSNVTKDLKRQLEYIREREIQKAKGKISKIPLQVSVISVIFYIPLILLLILSPVIINFIS